MAELITTMLNPDSHLLLDAPLLRLPHELLRKNFKSAQRSVEMASTSATAAIQAAASSNPAEMLAALDATLAKAQNLKRKLEALRTEEAELHRQQHARLQHLQQLHVIPALADVKYDAWAKVRLDRLLVDYLLRAGYNGSARDLAREKGIEALVDVAVFDECGRISARLKEGKLHECLAWCAENKQALKKTSSHLELELRLQQLVEMARTGDEPRLLEGIAHARKYLSNAAEKEFALRAGGLLAHGEWTWVEPYKTMYSPTRYAALAALFLKTHHDLLSLPPQPLLHTALAIGLSALKTPSCHSDHAVRSASGTAVCPICSAELHELARHVPYAHHTKSYIEDDPVVLPNGRVYGRERLRVLNEKLQTPTGRVRDPAEGSGGHEWSEREVRKVFVS